MQNFALQSVMFQERTKETAGFRPQVMQNKYLKSLHFEIYKLVCLILSRNRRL